MGADDATEPLARRAGDGATSVNPAPSGPLTVAILGLGLIGGSLGLALCATGRYYVLGYARRPETARRARELGVIHAVAPTLESAGRAHVVIAAVPVLAIEELFRRLAPHLGAGTVVTDVGSTKVLVEQWAARLLPGVPFVGGHPIAGKELSGIEHADRDLFLNRIWAVVPPRDATRDLIDRVVTLVEDTGAVPLQISAAAHDAAVAATSHLPFVVSALLGQTVWDRPDWPTLQPLAGSGLRDTTRLASGDPVMHRDICAGNRAAILDALDDFIRHATSLRDLLSQPKHDEALLSLLQRTKQARDRWLTRD